MNIFEDLSTTTYDTRTPEFYDRMRRQNWTETDIAKFRSRMQKNGNDTLTDHIIHEARNAVGIIRAKLTSDELIVTSDDFTRGRILLLKSNQGFGWFKQNGPIPKNELQSFLDEAESLGEWNLEVVDRIYTRLNALIDRYSADEQILSDH